MTTPSKADYYAPLPLHVPHSYVVLTPYYPSPNRGRCRIICTVSLILLAAIVYAFWPSEPDVKIVRLRLKRIHIHTIPRMAVDISMFVTVRVRNSDVYSMDYRALEVAVGYRGKRLGHVRSERGHVRARGSSYVDAELDFDGVELLADLVHLLEDLAKGTVPFDTVTEIEAQLGLLFFQVPLLVKLSSSSSFFFFFFFSLYIYIVFFLKKLSSCRIAISFTNFKNS
jgi:LEA14-like dessication related protein